MERGAVSALPALWFLSKPKAEVQSRWIFIPSPCNKLLVTAWLSPCLLCRLVMVRDVVWHQGLTSL